MKISLRRLMVLGILAWPGFGLAQVAPCTPEQTKEATAATAKGRNALLKTINALKSNAPLADEKAKIWLGIADAGAKTKLIERLSKMFAATDGVTYRCSNQSTKANHRLFASILPSGRMSMLLGPSFWQAGDSGFDSKAGVMIHEISHLSIAGGANTVAPYEEEIYGRELNLKLAKTLPMKAQNNAESIQLFVEAFFYGLTP